MTSGKLIVIEGSDGSGKGTQQKLLLEYLKTQNIPHASFDFPQYYKTHFGRWIGRFLKGEFGDIGDVPPYIVSIPYAADRWQAKEDMDQALEEGKIVVVNRYTGSNAVYQSSKLPSRQRQAFVEWEFQMEYDAFGIPKEDLVIFLYVPFSYARKLIESKNNRKYLNNGKVKDIHESNLKFMKEVEKTYLDFCKSYPQWVRIDCVKNGRLLSKEEIHREVISVLKRKKVLNR